jgi:hypothetical protein
MPRGRRADWADTAYQALIIALAALLLASPVLRALSGVDNFDRPLDALSVAFLLARIAESGSYPLPRTDRLLLGLLLLGFAVAAAANAATSPLFQFRLLLIDGKVVLFAVILWSFQNRPIAPRIARRSAKILFYAALLSIVAFLALSGFSQRLKLLDESNYMVVAIILIGATYFSDGTIRRDVAFFVLLVLVCVIARSRTGFALLAFLFFVPRELNARALLAPRRLALNLALLTGAAVALYVTGGALIDFVARGQTDIESVDRFIFFKEFVYQWQQSRFGFWIANNIGTYLSQPPQYMQYWVAKLNSQQGIPFGLAPFDFHSMYLRLAANVGILPMLAAVLFLARVTARSIGARLTGVLLIAGISMSTFYLSAIVPFIIVAGLLRTRDVRTSSLRAARQRTTIGRRVLAPT